MIGNKENRLKGLFIGGIVGDAFGSPYEFKQQGSYTITDQMEYNGVFKIPAGSFTDDSSMMLCLAQSLIDTKGFSASDQMRKYVDWMMTGYMSSNDERGCFDIGRQTKTAIYEYIKTVRSGNPSDGYHGSAGGMFASGNGGIMRMAPIMVFYHMDVATGLQRAQDSSRVTHGSPECLESAWLMAYVVFLLLEGTSKDDVLRAMWNVKDTLKEEKVRDIAGLTWAGKKADYIFTSGYVIHTLEAALWGFFMTDTFKRGMMVLAEMGRDVDTVCCVYGQIAGAFYGYSAIPDEWITSLQKKDLVQSVCATLVNESFLKHPTTSPSHLANTTHPLP